MYSSLIQIFWVLRNRSIVLGGLFVVPRSEETWLKAVFLFAIAVNAGLCGSLWSELKVKESLRTMGPSESRLMSAPTAGLAVASIAAAYLSELPEKADAPVLLARIQRLAIESEVALVRLAPSREPATPGQPAALNWDVQMTGNYPAIKRFLGRLLDQSPELWVTRLHLKPGVGGVDVDFSVRAWSRADLSPHLQRRDSP